MAITKIKARNGGLKRAIDYILNGEKTDEQILTYHQNCDPNHAYQQMTETKKNLGKEGGIQYYHLIQSFKPNEITPELALEIAQTFAKEQLSQYQAVISVHVDKNHIHAHTIFNSVSWETGRKYHSNAKTYYEQIRATSDRLCRKHGLSVIEEHSTDKPLSYIEWLRKSKGQPTFRSMLQADLDLAIEEAVDYGNFLMIMEHLGYEVKHGVNLGFRLRGQERFQKLGRRNEKYTEEGIRNAIDGRWENPLQAVYTTSRPQYIPYKKRPKYKGFMALYVHYLYILGKIEKREYPPKLTPKTKVAIMKFEKLKEEYAFMSQHNITDKGELSAFKTATEERIQTYEKERTFLNSQKKRRANLYSALADVEAIAPVKTLHEEGVRGMEDEYQRYQEAVKTLEKSGVSKEELTQEKQEVYEKIATINVKIREQKSFLKLCQGLEREVPTMEEELRKIQAEREVKAHERGRR